MEEENMCFNIFMNIVKYYTNEFLTVKSDEEAFRAFVLGISEFGLLKLKHESGEIKTYDVKELKFVY